MKKVIDILRSWGLKLSVPLLLVLLCILTVSTITAISWSNVTVEGGFELAGLTDEARHEEVDVYEYLLPSFIGVTLDGEKRGISASANIVSDLYELICPTLHTALTSVVPLPDTVWNGYTSEETSVYIKYHSELPDGMIALFAGGEPEGELTFSGGIRELFYIPSSENGAILVTRSNAGDIRRYVIPSRKTTVGTEELERFVRSYGSAMPEFIFNEDRYDGLAWSEPIFTEALQTRSLIMTERTCALIQNSATTRDAVLRLFGINPDKLLGIHEESDGTGSYSDTHGILYLRDSSFIYTSSSAENGQSVRELTGSPPSEEGLMWDYVQAALILYESIERIDEVYTGGEAELLLRSVSSSDGEVTLCFMYAVGNVPIADERDAYSITFRDGRIESARLHTIAVRILAERDISYTEWWFASMLDLDRTARDVRLVYRSDYVSESVSAEWSAELLKEQAEVAVTESWEGENGE